MNYHFGRSTITKTLRVTCALCAFGLAAANFCQAQPAANSPPKYILFLTADGFRTDYLEWYQPTNLNRLVAEGTRVAHAENVFPTVTAPNMTSLVTGAYPRTTTVAANKQYVKDEDRIVDHIRSNRAETIAATLRKAGWKTAGVNHFMLQNAGTDFYATAGYDESEKTTDAILEMLKKPHAAFVGAIYGAADHAGHEHGPRSEEVKQAVLGIDRAIGRLVAGLRELGIYDQTVISFNADHGMSSFEKQGVSDEPAKALKKAGFKVAASEEQLNPDTQIVVIPAGAHMVYFRKVTEGQRKEALRVLAQIKGAEILDRPKLDALGCHDNLSGDVIVSPLPGYTISHAGGPGGQHGRFAERNPVLFFCGPGIKRGATVENARTVDVVPTLLHLVHVPPAGTVEGRVIEAALEKSAATR